MEILSQILSSANLNLAYYKVVNNKGAAGIEKMTNKQKSMKKALKDLS